MIGRALVAVVLTPGAGWATGTLSVAPDRLPLSLVAGWEAADGEPPGGVIGLDRLRWRPADPLREAGPPESVRWYRIRLDLSACRGVPLAFHAPAIRDVDETYLDGRPVGKTGSFPPDVDLATIHFRLYALPTDVVNAPGPHVLAIRVYQGPSLTPVFRFPPQLDQLAVITQRRSWFDHVLTALAAMGLSLTVAFVLFYRTARSRVYLLFAAFSLLCVLYLLTGHSIWNAFAIQPSFLHRVVMITGPLLCVLYFQAMWRLLEVPPPRRFRIYVMGFCAYAVLGAVAADLRLLVIPTRLVRALALISLADMLLPTFRAARQGRPRAWSVLAGHLVFGLAIVWLNLTLLPAPWFYLLLAVAFLLLAVTLYSVGSQQAEARLAAVLAERGRIAREIHDNLAQGLVAITLQLEAADEALGSSPSPAREHVERARALARSSLGEARRSVWDLHPGLLDGQGLATALEQIADRLGATGQTRVRVEVAGVPPSLPAAVERNLLQIAKEALTNALTHARARQVHVRLAFGSAEIGLLVEDDGSGFDVGRLPERGGEHFGLRGMRERTSELGGRLTVDSRPGAGTRVTASFPVAPAAATPYPPGSRGGPRGRLREALRAWR